MNDNLLSVIIDNKQYTNEKYKFYMDDNLDIMMPVSILRDALNCSAHIYDGDRLVVEKHSSNISFSLDQETATVNGDIEKITSPFTMIDNRVISVSMISHNIWIIHIAGTCRKMRHRLRIIQMRRSCRPVMICGRKPDIRSA